VMFLLGLLDLLGMIRDALSFNVAFNHGRPILAGDGPARSTWVNDARAPLPVSRGRTRVVRLCEIALARADPGEVKMQHGKSDVGQCARDMRSTPRRYLAEVPYRFNRRAAPCAMLPRLAVAVAHTRPCPRRMALGKAEVRASPGNFISGLRFAYFLS
jgi:hypothetical protein